MGRIYAGALGLLAFLTMIARGLIVGASGPDVMLSAVGCLFGFAAIGWLAGMVAEQTVTEAVQRRFDEEVAAAESADEPNQGRPDAEHANG